jgi:hypothetical protein
MKTRITVHSKCRYEVGPAASFTFPLAAREDLSASPIRRIVAGLLSYIESPPDFRSTLASSTRWRYPSRSSNRLVTSSAIFELLLVAETL